MNEALLKSYGSPTASEVHVDVPLTEFGQMWMQETEAFISQRAMPNLPVSQQSNKYYIWNRGDFYRNEADVRADGTETQGGEFRLSTSDYSCEVYGWHKQVTDRQRANADSSIDLDEQASRYVTRKMMLKREVLFLTTYFGTSIWSTDVTGVASSPSSTQFIFWDSASSDPIKDVRKGMRTVQGATGYRPNKMMIGREAYDALLDNDAVLERITGGSTRNLPAQVMRALLAALFELEAIFVADAVQNTAKKGATEATSFIAGDNALLYYAPDSVGPEEPTAGTQFSWTGYLPGQTAEGLVISRFREDLKRADRVEGEMSFDYKVTAPELGYFFSNCVQ